MPTGDGTVLLDTHVLLWWQAESDRLSKRGREQITTAGRVLVSPISCWEVAMLIDKQRVSLDRPTAVWVQDLFTSDVSPANLTPGVAVAAAELVDFPGDPADRFIYATARSLDCPLISQDQAVRRYARKDRSISVIW